MIGDWMASDYDARGNRRDLLLSLQPDGRYQWTVRSEPSWEQSVVGRWESAEADPRIWFYPAKTGDTEIGATIWQVLSVNTCEDSNCLLVLREVRFAGRNLPVCFYRVHRTPQDLQPLSDRDRDLFLDLLVNPPEPNAAFRKAAEAYKKRHG